MAEIEAKKAEKMVRPNEFKYVIIVRTCFRIRLCVFVWPRANSCQVVLRHNRKDLFSDSNVLLVWPRANLCQVVVRHNRKDLFSDSNVRASLISCNFVSRT